MTEYFHKDTGLTPEPARVVNPNETETETITERVLGKFKKKK